MERSLAWALNFDAEDELAAPRTYGGPKSSLAAVLAENVRRAGLVRAGDVILDAVVGGGDARGLPGAAWCPTPRALARLREAGAIVPTAPPLAVLRAANDRALAASLGQTLAGAAYVTTIDDAERVLRAARGSTWLAKRAFGYAGRGRRKMTPGALGDHDRAWLAASFRVGGVQLEPYVKRIADYATHGFVDAHGTARFGALTTTVCDESGAWRGSARVDDAAIEVEQRAAIARGAERAAAALAGAGYFGPFGVDAYLYVADDGGVRVNAASDINARFTMGFAVGFPDFARELCVGRGCDASGASNATE